jgi:hypothetical protein
MSYQTHLDKFGMCQCENRSSIEMLELEVSDNYGKCRVKKIPACGDCYRLV